jgi:hypothetical protein
MHQAPSIYMSGKNDVEEATRKRLPARRDIYVSNAHQYHVPADGSYLRPGFSSLSR